MENKEKAETKKSEKILLLLANIILAVGASYLIGSGFEIMTMASSSLFQPGYVIKILILTSGGFHWLVSIFMIRELIE